MGSARQLLMSMRLNTRDTYTPFLTHTAFRVLWKPEDVLPCCRRRKMAGMNRTPSSSTAQWPSSSRATAELRKLEQIRPILPHEAASSFTSWRRNPRSDAGPSMPLRVPAGQPSHPSHLWAPHHPHPVHVQDLASPVGM